MNTVTSTSNNAAQYQNNYNTSVKKETEVSNKYEDRNNYTRELGNVSFEIKRDENLDPYSVSYEDYKGLNYTALETIFGKDTPELASASGLIATTSITKDDDLNKIFFDKELETKGEGEDSKMYKFALMEIATMEFRKRFESDVDSSLYKKFYNEDGSKPTFEEFNNINKSNPTFTTSNKLFEDFDKYKEFFYSDMQDTWSGNVDINKIFNVMDEIKSLYQTKVEEKDALLEQLTKNNKPNPIESLS